MKSNDSEPGSLSGTSPAAHHADVGGMTARFDADRATLPGRPDHPPVRLVKDGKMDSDLLK
jgi:hypothetical protein